MKTKTPVDGLGKAEEKVFNYLDWLENTGRLTTEEGLKLEQCIQELVAAAMSFTARVTK